MSNDDWITPPWIVSALGPFDLDPCAAEQMPHSTAREMVRPPEDGLSIEWDGRVWLNPPYSKPGPWVARMTLHNCGTALLNVSTTSQWFRMHVFYGASALLFPEKRIRFCDVNGVESTRPRYDNVIAAYGIDDANKLYRAWATDRIPGTYIPMVRNLIGGAM